jgi:hypothetical protein
VHGRPGGTWVSDESDRVAARRHVAQEEDARLARERVAGLVGLRDQRQRAAAASALASGAANGVRLLTDAVGRAVLGWW